MNLPLGKQNQHPPASDPVESNPLRWALQEDNEDWYRDLVEHSQDVLAVHDLEGHILAINPTPARLTGYTVEELIKIPLRELIAPEFRAQFDDYLKEIKSNREARGLMVILTRSGEKRIWEYRSALRKSNGNAPTVRCLAHDVSDIMREQRALRATNQALRNQTVEQQRLLREAQLFRTLLDNSHDAVHIIEPHTLRILDINQQGCLELGYSREKLLRMTVFDFAPELNASGVSRVLAQLKETGSAIFESVHRRQDGTTFPVEINLRQVHLDHTYHVAVSRNISDRKQSEEALRQSEADLHRAQSIAHIGSWRFDLLQRTGSFSAETYRILGLSPTSLLTYQDAMEKVYAEDFTKVSMEWAKSLSSGTFDLEHRIVLSGHVSPEVRWVRTRAQLEYDADHRPLLAVGTLQDITESKRSEERLREFERVVESVADMIVVVDRDYRYTLANPAFLRYWKKTSDQVIGHFVDEMARGDLFEKIVKPKLDECFHGEVVQFEHSISYPGMGQREMSITYSPVEGPAGIEGAACVARDITERKRAEQALRLTEARERARSRELETVLETVPVAVYIARDPDCLRVTGNSAAYQQLGAPPGSNLSRGASVEERPNIRVLDNGIEVSSDLLPFQQSASTGRAIHNRSLTILLPDGGRKETIVNVAPLFDEDGRPRGAVAASIDVTDLKQTEQALRHSETRFRMLYERAPVGIALVDATNLHFVQTNPRFCEIVGRTAAELERMSIHDVTHPEDRDVGVSQLPSLAAGQLLQTEVEKRYLRPDGSFRWGRVVTVPMFAQTEEDHLLFMALVEDITERNRAQDELRQSEARFRMLYERAPIGIALVDYERSNFVQVNPAFCDLIGRSPEELEKLTTRDITHPDDADIGVSQLPRLTNGELQQIEVEKRYLRPDGSIRWARVCIVPMFTESTPESRLFMALVEDISESRRAEETMLATVDQLRQVTTALEAARGKLTEEKLYLEEAISGELGFGDIVGRSDALQQVMNKVAKVAPSNATVLLLGETGTGKELVARAIHRMSRRPNQPFIKMNCAAIPSGLLESELFGHEKGAFTGAVAKKIGRIELADQGTLFLDEIGEIPLDLQPKLLRVLQDREFERLGGTHTIKVDFRLVAATNRDLWQSVNQHEFRSDLYYRLHVFPIRTPPLRERREDIPLLVEHFVKKTAGRMNKSITSIPAKAMEPLVQWSWPGNIRELENFVERSVILTTGSVLQVPVSELFPSKPPENDSLRESDRERILQVLRECNGQLGGPDGAAARLGLKRTTLQSRLVQLGISPGNFRSQS